MIVLFLLFLGVVLSCDMLSPFAGGGVSPVSREAAGRDEAPDSPGPDSGARGAGSAVSDLPPLNRRGAVLIRGNGKTAGIPGFGDNALPALYGEYRIEIPGRDANPETAELNFRVWVSNERLYYPGNVWGPRNISSLFSAMERRDGEALIIAAALGTNPGPWTAVFYIVPVLEGELNPQALNLLLHAWLSRFSYFMSFIARPTDISMPAIVYF